MVLAVDDLPDAILPEDLHPRMETAGIYHLTHITNPPAGSIKIDSKTGP
jgi:hypothetical protein